jgi:hypothetical protein
MKNAEGLFNDFASGNFKGGLEKISETIEKFNPKDALGQVYKKVKEEIHDIINDPISEKLKKGAEKILGHVNEGIKNISEGKFSDGFDKFKTAGKEFLDCVGKLFTAIKEGLENGFDKIKNSIKTTWEKLSSLCQTNEKTR